MPSRRSRRQTKILALWLLLLAEWACIAVLVFSLVEPGSNDARSGSFEGLDECPSRPSVQAAQIRAVNLAARQHGERFLDERGVGERVVRSLIDFQENGLLRANILRSQMINGTIDLERATVHIGEVRVRVFSGAAQLLEPELAGGFERELFAAWDRAWLDHAGDLEARGSVAAAESLVGVVPEPVESP